MDRVFQLKQRTLHSNQIKEARNENMWEKVTKKEHREKTEKWRTNTTLKPLWYKPRQSKMLDTEKILFLREIS